MNKGSSLALVLILAIFVNAFGQTPGQQSRTQAEQDEVVRITTNLVQVDVVVTDKKGQVVTGLTAEDFEITEDGRPQKVTNLTFVSTDPPSQPVPPSNKGGDKNAITVPPVRIQPTDVRRTVALVVDDLCLSWTSMAYARKAIRKFVDEDMQPGDLVAIIRTAGSIGILQQFTSDKRQLYAAIERLKWYPLGCSRLDAFDQLNQDLQPPLIGEGPLDRSGTADMSKTGSGFNERDPLGDSGRLRQEVLTVGTLGALSHIIRGMKELPGRKSVLFVSDGFALIDRTGKTDNRRVLEALDRVTDLAGRSSVVVYTLEARGLVTTNFTAADSISGAEIRKPDFMGGGAALITSRAGQLNDTQAGLIYLAKQTGGFPIYNTNDLSKGIRKVFDDQKSYYLLGYRPDESTFDQRTGRRRFHKLSVKVKRPGLTVRTRTGFYGVAEEEIAPESNTRAQQLIRALVSPFSSSGVQLRLTSLFSNDAREGSYMRSVLYIDAKGLTFKEEPDGWYQTVMDVMAVTFGDNGRVVDQINKTQTIRVRGATYRNVLKNGLVYVLNVPVKKAGAYQLRVAVRDSSSEQLGSASQFIEVPDLGKKRLTLSGLVVNGYQAESASRIGLKTSSANAQAEAASGSEGAREDVEPQASVAVRRFRQGMFLNYAFVIYNAQLDKGTRQPKLETQLRVFRDGRLIFTGQPQPVDVSNQQDMTRLIAGSGLQLGPDMPAGEYVLQVVVIDLLAKDKKRRTATQWIDFEIVR